MDKENSVVSAISGNNFGAQYRTSMLGNVANRGQFQQIRPGTNGYFDSTNQYLVNAGVKTQQHVSRKAAALNLHNGTGANHASNLTTRRTRNFNGQGSKPVSGGRTIIASKPGNAHIRHFKSLSNISSSKNQESNASGQTNEQPFKENNIVSNIQVNNHRIAKIRSVDPDDKLKNESLTRQHQQRPQSKNKSSGGKKKVPLP